MNPIYFDRELAIYHPVNNQLMQTDFQELIHFKQVISTFYNYINDMKFEIKRISANFQQIPEHQLKLLKMNYQERVNKLQQSILKNAEFCFLIVASYIDLFPDQDLSKVSYVSDLPYFPMASQADIAKLRITLKQFYRDWSKQGQYERDQCYTPMIDKLLEYYPKPNKEKVLLPGCGLGRLVFELSLKGFSAQGNEISYFMLLGSHFIINLAQQKEQFEITPFANNFCNRFNEDDSFERVFVPDVLASDLLTPDHEMSIVSGEFMAVYNTPKNYEQWDSVLTCFFIDTANNILDYIETIYKLLKPNGIWINLGPLEYHFANQFSELSIELSWEDIKNAIIKIGFHLDFEEIRQSTYNYSKNEQKSLVYNCLFFGARKVVS